MMRGESIHVQYRQAGSHDPFGQVSYSYSDPVAISNVLVEPAAGTDAIETIRPDGIDITYTLRFPRSYDGPSLADALIEVRGNVCKVIGKPDRYDGAISPTEWNMTVRVQAVEG